MSNMNLANRQVCDVDIRLLLTNKPFLYFETANTTTVGLSGSSVYAQKKGTRAIAFYDPLGGTMTIESQITPFKAFSLFTDGVIEQEATFAIKKKVVCRQSGKLFIVSSEAILDENSEVLTDEEGYTIIDETKTYPMLSGSVFVYAEGDEGEDYIDGNFDVGTFTATNESDITVDNVYDVYYLVSKEGVVRKISINNDALIPDYFITMSTLNKNEEGELVPFNITAFKAHIQRNIEMTFSSEGEPRSIEISFELLHDSNNRILELCEEYDNE